MLKFMRERMGKTFLVLIVAGISLVFVLFGVFPEARMGGGASGSAVAAVGGEKITAQQLQNAVQREMESYKALGMDLPPELAANIKRGTLESLIQGKLMLVEAKRLGIQVSNAAVTEEIRKMPYFIDKNTKAFSVEQYRQVLAANHLSPGQFEEDVRQGLVHQRMQKFLSDRIRVTPVEVEREFQVSNDTRDLFFERFTREDAMKKMEVSGKELDAFLADKNREEQISAFYAQNNVRYNKPEQICGRHILKHSAPGSTETTPPKEFLALKPTPANFAAVAQKNSDDPGSKTKGGDLDCFGKGVMDPAFEKAAFALPVGRVSEPVKSQFGWHYILITKKNAAVHQPLDKVRREIATDLIKREKTDEIRKTNLALAEQAVKSWGVKSSMGVTGPFSRLEGSIPKIGRAPEILAAAFDPKAKIQTGPQIFESQGGVIVASVKERKSPDMAKFAKERETHATTLKERKLRAFLPAWLEDVKSRTKISYNAGLINQL